MSDPQEMPPARIEHAAHLYALNHPSLTYNEASLQFYYELLSKELAAGRRREFAIACWRPVLQRIRFSGPLRESA